MKKVMGGNPPTATCTASCEGASAVSIDCAVDCTARDNIGVFCGGEKKCCYDAPCNPN